MKPAFSYPAITIIFLVFSAVLNGQQNNQPAHSLVQTDPVQTITTDTLKKTNSAPGIASPAKTDSLKTTKKKKSKKEQADVVNPYQPYTPDGKPLPYNTYRESRREPVRTDSLGGEILRTILKNNIRN